MNSSRLENISTKNIVVNQLEKIKYQINFSRLDANKNIEVTPQETPLQTNRPLS